MFNVNCPMPELEAHLLPEGAPPATSYAVRIPEGVTLKEIRLPDAVADPA